MIESQQVTEMMIVEGVEVVEKRVESQGLITQGKKSIDTDFPSSTRVPLQDCTNGTPVTERGDELTPIPSSKGNWKRWVRMQGMGIQRDSINGGQIVEEASKKRDWQGWEGDKENFLEMQPIKKGKLNSDRSVITISEVEETSRNWSRVYK